MPKIYGVRSEYLVRQEKSNLKQSKIISYILTLALGIFTAQVTDFAFGDYSRIVQAAIFIPIFFIELVIIRVAFNRFTKKKRTAGNYSVGSKGEDWTFEELSKLPPDYIVFRDVQLKGSYSNIDFVVLGSTGLFTVESKSHGGNLHYDGVLKRDGKEFEHDFLKQAAKQSADLREYIFGAVKIPATAIPLLVFSNPKAWVAVGDGRIEGVNVLHARLLNNFILNQPQFHYNISAIERVLVPLVKLK